MAEVARWLKHFRAEMQPLVEAECEQQRQQQPKRRGRPTRPLVTGYVIGVHCSTKNLTRRCVQLAVRNSWLSSLLASLARMMGHCSSKVCNRWARILRIPR